MVLRFFLIVAFLTEALPAATVRLSASRLQTNASFLFQTTTLSQALIASNERPTIGKKPSAWLRRFLRSHPIEPTTPYRSKTWTARPGVVARMIAFKPQDVLIRLHVDESMLDYDFSQHNFIDPLPPGTTFKAVSNHSFKQMVGTLERVDFAVTAQAGNLWASNSVLVQDGRVIKRRAPGLRTSSMVELNGAFPFFVLDADQIGIQDVVFQDGKATKHVPFENGISGPVILRDGNVVTDQIKQVVPNTGPNQVMWNPQTYRAAATVIGKNAVGEVVLLTMSGNGQSEPTLEEIANELKAENVVDAILLARSGDVGYYDRNQQDPFLIGSPASQSVTARQFPDGRPVSVVLFGRPSPGPVFNLEDRTIRFVDLQELLDELSDQITSEIHSQTGLAVPVRAHVTGSARYLQRDEIDLINDVDILVEIDVDDAVWRSLRFEAARSVVERRGLSGFHMSQVVEEEFKPYFLRRLKGRLKERDIQSQGAIAQAFRWNKVFDVFVVRHREKQDVVIEVLRQMTFLAGPRSVSVEARHHLENIRDDDEKRAMELVKGVLQLQFYFGEWPEYVVLLSQFVTAVHRNDVIGLAANLLERFHELHAQLEQLLAVPFRSRQTHPLFAQVYERLTGPVRRDLSQFENRRFNGAAA